MALLDAGVQAGDHVAILSENREEWVFADLAAQAIGARSVGVYPTNPEPEVAYVLDHSQSVLVVARTRSRSTSSSGSATRRRPCARWW
jgi:long-chain acyl-CoA synthetase